MATTLKKKLSQVYKAKDCTDKRDAEIALKEINELVKRYGWTPALRRRFYSLKTREKKLK
jgi:hypothetical protein